MMRQLQMPGRVRPDLDRGGVRRGAEGTHDCVMSMMGTEETIMASHALCIMFIVLGKSKCTRTFRVKVVVEGYNMADKSYHWL
jgi:hypothetical protein